MKLLKSLLVILSLLLSMGIGTAGADELPQNPPPAPPVSRAVRIVFQGGIAGFDRGAHKAILSVVGLLVSEGWVDTYITEIYNLDGGGTFCLRVNPGLTADAVMVPLKTIHPDSTSTEFSMTPVDQCNKSPALE